MSDTGSKNRLFLIVLAAWAVVGVLLALFWLPIFNILRFLVLPF